VYLYVCVCINVNTHTHICIFTYKHTHTYKQHTHTYTHAHKQTQYPIISFRRAAHMGWLRLVSSLQLQVSFAEYLFHRALLQGSFAKETYHFKEPTNRSHPISTGTHTRSHYPILIRGSIGSWERHSWRATLERE